MTAPAPPAPALWLESRYDRAVRLRVSRERLCRRFGGAADAYTRARLSRHLDLIDAALDRLGATP